MSTNHRLWQKICEKLAFIGEKAHHLLPDLFLITNNEWHGKKDNQEAVTEMHGKSDMHLENCTTYIDLVTCVWGDW